MFVSICFYHPSFLKKLKTSDKVVLSFPFPSHSLRSLVYRDGVVQIIHICAFDKTIFILSNEKLHDQL